MKNHCSNGPVSTLAGATWTPEPGTDCDQHKGVPAISKIQGETDSFGAEYHYACQSCLTIFRQHAAQAKIGTCDWCNNSTDTLRDHRDMDEGRAGPVYRVCQPCRSKETESLQEELQEMRSEEGYVFDDDERYDDDIPGTGDDDDEDFPP